MSGQTYCLFLVYKLIFIGQSLGDMETASSKQQRRASAEAGKRNFRSKRFSRDSQNSRESRNMEREPALRRSHSIHGDQVLEVDL